MGTEAITGFFAGMPTDWLILGGAAILVSFVALRSGARPVCTAALALPLALFIFPALSMSALLGSALIQFSSPSAQAMLLGALFVGGYLLVNRIGLEWRADSGRPVQAAVAGVAFVVLAATIWVGTPALQSVWAFGPQTQGIFGAGYGLLWLLGSYAALAFIRA